MCRWFVCVTLLTLSLLVECLFSGDGCVADEDRPGACTPLSECASLMAEIQRAGTPMPSHVRRKLQALACGFQDAEPLVCCASPFSGTDPDDGDDLLPPTNTGLLGGGGGSTWQTERPWTRPTPDRGDQNRPTERPSWTRPTDPPWTRPTPDRGDHNNRPTEPSWSRPTPDRGDHNNRPTEPPWSRPTPDQGNHRPTQTVSNPHGSAPNIQNHRNLRKLPTNCGVVETDKIWGGNRTRLFEMPWMVLISYDSPRGPKLSCGGTLITENYVMTAAHCVSFLGNRLTLRGVVLGEYDVRKDPDCERVEGELHCAPNVRNVSIETVIAHPGYTPQTLYDDIALIKLAEPADFTLDSMKPLCLPSTPQLQRESLEGVNAVVAGWGATEDGLQSPVLLSVDLPVVENRDCQDAYNGTPQIYERQMCAGGVQDKDSCGGDSGGPLMYPGKISSGTVRYVQRGIISYGSKRCGLGGFPGVYTRVSHYMDWILDNIDN